MTKIKAIVHDWDDTVTNAYEVYGQFFFDFGDFFGLPLTTQEKIKQSWGKTVAGIAQDQWPQLSDSDVDQMLVTFRHSWGNEIPYAPKVFPGVSDLLHRLSQKFTLGILSSEHKPQIEHLYKSQIHPDTAFHEFILAPPDLTAHKPDPKVFDQVFEYLTPLGIAENETLYVGDNLTDYFAARDRGLIFYAVTTGVTTKEVFSAEGLDKDFIKKDFSEFCSEML